MPRGDRTGPMGMGPMTGRGAGYCAGNTAPGYANPGGFTGGYPCGYGRGRGYRGMYYGTGMPGWARYGGPAFDEKAYLNNQAEYLEGQLRMVRDRLSGLNEEFE